MRKKAWDVVLPQKVDSYIEEPTDSLPDGADTAKIVQVVDAALRRKSIIDKLATGVLSDHLHHISFCFSILNHFTIFVFLQNHAFINCDPPTLWCTYDWI